MAAKRSKGKATKENKQNRIENKRQNGFLKFLVGMIGVIISPLVVFIKLFNVGEPIPRRWLISLSVILFICVGTTWTASFFVDNLSSESIAILAEYNKARINVRETPYLESINYIALKHDVDPCLVSAIVSQQSGFQSEMVSFRGNRGLMQISPEVWRIYKPYANCSGDHIAPQCSFECVFNVESNIDVGSAYLQYMINLYDGDIVNAVAAYTLGVAPVYIPVPEDGIAEADTVLDDNATDETTGENELEENLQDTINVQTYIPPEVASDVGYTPSILQTWINNRSETLQDRVSLVVSARQIRTIMSIVTVIMALIMMCSIIFKYHPKQDHYPQREEDDDYDSM